MTDNNVIDLKNYSDKNIKHVLHNRESIEQLYECPVCGLLPIVEGVVVHQLSSELHSGLSQF
jgi:formate dehydrogenase maturation protein FdhE